MVRLKNRSVAGGGAVSAVATASPDLGGVGVSASAKAHTGARRTNRRSSTVRSRGTSLIAMSFLPWPAILPRRGRGCPASLGGRREGRASADAVGFRAITLEGRGVLLGRAVPSEDPGYPAISPTTRTLVRSELPGR